MQKFYSKGICNTDSYAKLLIIKNKKIATYDTLSNLNIIFKIYWLSGSRDSMYSNTYAICNSSSSEIKIQISLLDNIQENEYVKNSVAAVKNSNGDIEVYIKRTKNVFGIACVELINEYDNIAINPILTFDTNLSELINPFFESTPNIITRKRFYKSNDFGKITYTRIGNIINVHGQEILTNSTEKIILNIGSENANKINMYTVGRCTSTTDNSTLIMNVKIETNGDIKVTSAQEGKLGVFCITYIIS